MGLSMKQVSLDDLFDNWLQPSESPRPPQSNNKRPRQVLQQPEPLNCPRCNSTNTKFCYYNNYNRTQPRHFCKSCKRHWTKGGTLRNVPVGGGRKNKRHKPSQPAANITPTLSSLNQTTDNYVHHQQLSFLDLDDNALIGDTKTLMNQPMQFLFSGSNFESSRSSNVTNNIATASFQKQENMEKSVIECIVQGNINYEAWELEVGASTNFSVMELPSRSYWNWNDFDTTVSDFSIPNWDETDIKP